MYARYTERLRDLMLNESTKTAIDKALSTYPLYSPSKLIDLIPSRETLNMKLLNHYKYREIGFETVGRFLDELEITMCEIMPRYNELFKTVEIMANIEDPFGNVDIVESFKQTSTNSSTSQGSNSQSMTSESENSGKSDASISNTANSKGLNSDTPQSEISVGTKDIDSVGYASEANWNEAISNGTDSRTTSDTSSSESSTSGSSTGSSESESTLEHTFTKKGNQGVNTYAHDMNEFRTSIIDVVDQIINDIRIQELFMMVY